MDAALQAVMDGARSLTNAPYAAIITLPEAAGQLEPAETAQFHRIIRDQLDQMRQLIGDLLDVARLMAEHRPHVALLDLVLPSADGIQLMRQVHRIADVPVIFLSVYEQDEKENDYAVLVIDRTFVKAHRSAAGARRNGLTPELSRQKQGIARKFLADHDIKRWPRQR